MSRLVLLLSLVSAGCTSVGIASIDEEGWIDDGSDDPYSDVDDALWDGAMLRIVSPASASFLPWEEVHPFVAEVVDAEGNVLDFDEIHWTSTADAAWSRDGARFEDDSLDVGLHDLTASVELPNGDRLAYTSGGVLVQSRFAGTYSGLFTSEITYDTYTVGCAGSVVIIVDPYGEVAAGDAQCVTALQGYEVKVDYLFDLENHDGVVTGTAGADIFGWFQYDFPATGTLDPDADGLAVTFGGTTLLAVDGAVDAERISLDAGM